MSRMVVAVSMARVVSEQYAAAKSRSRSLLPALAASALPDSVRVAFDQPCSLLYRLKNVCPCRTICRCTLMPSIIRAGRTHGTASWGCRNGYDMPKGGGEPRRSGLPRSPRRSAIPGRHPPVFRRHRGVSLARLAWFTGWYGTFYLSLAGNDHRGRRHGGPAARHARAR